MNKELENKLKIIINKFKIKDFNYVINKSKILLKKELNNDFLWNIQGLSYQQKGEYNKSKNSFENAILINSKNIAPKNNLGNSYKYLKDFTNAEKCFKELLKINPNHINALVNLGNLKIDLNNFDEAIIYLNKALSLVSSFSDSSAVDLIPSSTYSCVIPSFSSTGSNSFFIAFLILLVLVNSALLKLA